ncbi:hypothetical protein [Butyrivibrio sp. INlla14]|uniref:hypothetical protein n=1 Tax=Butyrivibrio sp. INlla14 TaxID=1520808 RepID=UPI0008774750|nr:hypothetical protein [Butyrivibrio sp. INlla14]SCY51889.1 hypothetical protein SAMN02910371_02618 [Butyrivibrio sp. INlla14]
MMKNLVNKKLVKAITIGISASMLLQPVAAYATDGEELNKSLTNGEQKVSKEPTATETVEQAAQSFDTEVNNETNSVSAAIAEVNANVQAIDQQFNGKENATEAETVATITNNDLQEVYNDNYDQIKEAAENLSKDVEEIKKDVENLNTDAENISDAQDTRNDAVKELENTDSVDAAAQKADTAYDGVSEKIA